MVSAEATTDDVTYFFPKNTDEIFSHRPLQSDNLFGCCVLTTPPVVIYLVFFSE